MGKLRGFNGIITGAISDTGTAPVMSFAQEIDAPVISRRQEYREHGGLDTGCQLTPRLFPIIRYPVEDKT